jgi:purine-cytosine permease-like protein
VSVSSTGPDDPNVRPRERHRRPTDEFAHDIGELREDLAFERETLQESISHDYSTSETGIVPLDRRRPMWHFAALWLTFASGFSFLFVGFELYEFGQSLARSILITCLGGGIFLAYALFSAYLGSRTGQTHALLSRSIFGVAGSWLVSLFILIAPLGWVAFQANLLAQIWDGLYGWGSLLTLSVVLAGVMILNNLLGFTGISVFARYLVTPLIVVWVLYMVIKVLVTDSDKLGGTPAGGGVLPFWALVGIVIGFSMWGNEPDIFRYGKPKFWWSLGAYAFGLIFGLLLFAIGGWMMANLANTADFGPVIRFTTQYSLFGAFWLAWILATIGQFAINDGNYYESINGGQNLIGGWKHWKRPYTCLVVAALGAFAGWWVNFHVLNGFFYVANFLAITVPCATVIMVVDHFLLPRLFGISRPLTRVPSWEEAGLVNVPAFIACSGAIIFGAYATHLFSFLGENSSRYWGPAPLEAWLLAGALYIVGVAIVRAVAPAKTKQLLGFDRHAMTQEVPPHAVIDIASSADVAPSMPLSVPARAN